MSRDSSGRVAFFLPSLDGGGAERATINLITGLDQIGVPVDLLLGRSGGPFTSLVPRSVEIVDLAAGRVLRAVIPMARYLRRRRPDTLVPVMDYASIAALEANRVAGSRARTITVSHSDPFRTSGNQRGAALMRLLMRITYPSASGHVAVSAGVAGAVARAAHIAPGKMTVIPNAVLTPALRQAAAAAGSQKTDPPLILGAGRLIASKDWPTLMNAVALVRRRREVRLTIMGSGPDRESLLALGASLFDPETFRLEAFTADPWPAMAAASVVALTSLSEGSPNVLIEAMACGTPVVASDCPYGPAEILEGGRFGSLVPCGQPAMVAEAIERELDQPRPAQMLRERAEDFSVERTAALWMKILAPERSV